MPVMNLWVRRSLALISGAGTLVGVAAITPAPAAAAIVQVTNTADSGAGSLRDALVNSVAGDTISFAPSVTGTIALASPLSIVTAVTIAGPGPGKLAIDGGGNVQDMVIGAGTGTVTVSGLTLTHGSGATGGAIKDYFGRALILNNVAITNSKASTSGGGVYVSQSSLSVIDSTISGNAAPQGGGIFVEVGPDSGLVVQGSTFSGNTATSGQGAGIYAAGIATIVTGSFRAAGSRGPHAVAPPPPPPPPIPTTSVGGVTITTSTVTGNTVSGDNAALYLHQLGSASALSSDTIARNKATGLILDSPTGGTPTVASTIVADNTADCGGGALTDGGYDIDSDGSCLFTAAGSHSHSTKISAALASLHLNGGPTATMSISPTHDPAHAVVPATFAVPGGSVKVCSTPDQRGVLPAGSPCDIGAFQRERAPKISVSLHSKSGRTHFGWYGSPVRVSFPCHSASPFISIKCSADVHLDHNGRHEGAKGKVVAQDGRSATAEVRGLKIDLTAPTIDGVKDGGSYSQDPKITCSDGLSGVARCKIDRNKRRSHVHFSVTAVDKAGNSTVRKGTYHLS